MNDTIAAIATAAGEGGIGIVRISGPESKEILGRIFAAKNKGKSSEKIEIIPRTLTYGYIFDPETKEAIDEVLAAYMPAPNTYTREDVVEINCHGGAAPLSKTLSLILNQGARLAEPGEFTRRAFLNGRLDLSQAEAVLDVINAKTEDSLSVAISQLQGKFSEEVQRIRESITEALIEIDVNIDYPDEDIEELTYEKLIERLDIIQKEIEGLLANASAGKILRDGLNVAIIGKPNAGKSSLLNLLLRESRAIVTEIPGTTRDTIEEFVNIKGIPVKLTDTAGIRETEDEIEKIGIKRSRESLENSDIAILMIDISERVDDELKSLVEIVDPERTLIVFNKDDKPAALRDEDIERLIENGGHRFAKALRLSLIEGAENAAIAEIENAIFELSGIGSGNEGPANISGGIKESIKEGKIVSNIRHKNMLERASKAIRDGRNSAAIGAPLELIEIDVRNAYEELGFITGDSVQDDIIDEIFSRFCLGK